MHIIKLNAIDSTNSYLRQLSLDRNIKDFTVVSANVQSEGRGQMGTHWTSEPSKNLMVSVFKDVSFLKLDWHFYISIVAAIALKNTLKQFSVKNIQIKWPNDILAEQKKIAGILIENVINHNTVKGSIIGVGLNVNQTNFEHLPQATSMRLISGRNYILDEVLYVFIDQLKQEFKDLERRDFKGLKAKYLEALFRKDKPSTFRNAEGHLFSGFILGISDSGRLQIKVEDGVIKTFTFKEISLLY